MSCEQALHFQESQEVTQEPHAKTDAARSRVPSRVASLAIIGEFARML